jgi:hypothetical protein
MPKEVKIKIVGKYNGHEIKPNKAVNLKFNFEYSELVECIKLHQLVNENIEVLAKIGDAKPIKLGTYMLDKYECDKNGECKLKLNSITDHVESNNLNILSDEPTKAINVLFRAEIDDSEEEGT